MPAFKTHDIWGVLACCLYLKITMLSDIVDEAGRYIEPWAMYGERQSSTNIQYPYQPKPPEEIWKIWRDCLHSTYIGTGRTHTIIPLHRPLNTKWYDGITEGQSLRTAIAMLPQYLREAFGTIQYPDENGDKLVEELIHTSDVHSWSDGTVKDAKGAHAYTFRPSNDNDKKSVVGTGMTPSDVTSLTSLQTEHYGALGVVIIITCLIKIHSIKEPIKGITHHIDSLTVRD